MVQVAKISKTDFDRRFVQDRRRHDRRRFANGGINAAPGEMVDIRRPGQSGGGGQVQTIDLNIPRPDEFFATHVRQMVEALNRAAPDGYILRTAPA
jgi:hypothetical protein